MFHMTRVYIPQSLALTAGDSQQSHPRGEVARSRSGT